MVQKLDSDDGEVFRSPAKVWQTGIRSFDVAFGNAEFRRIDDTEWIAKARCYVTSACSLNVSLLMISVLIP
jgi:hypothetical protein